MLELLVASGQTNVKTITNEIDSSKKEPSSGDFSEILEISEESNNPLNNNIEIKDLEIKLKSADKKLDLELAKEQVLEEFKDSKSKDLSTLLKIAEKNGVEIKSVKFSKDDEVVFNYKKSTEKIEIKSTPTELKESIEKAFKSRIETDKTVTQPIQKSFSESNTDLKSLITNTKIVTTEQEKNLINNKDYKKEDSLEKSFSKQEELKTNKDGKELPQASTPKLLTENRDKDNRAELTLEIKKEKKISIKNEEKTLESKEDKPIDSPINKNKYIEQEKEEVAEKVIDKTHKTKEVEVTKETKELKKVSSQIQDLEVNSEKSKNKEIEIPTGKRIDSEKQIELPTTKRVESEKETLTINKKIDLDNNIPTKKVVDSEKSKADSKQELEATQTNEVIKEEKQIKETHQSSKEETLKDVPIKTSQHQARIGEEKPSAPKIVEKENRNQEIDLKVENSSKSVEKSIKEPISLKDVMNVLDTKEKTTDEKTLNKKPHIATQEIRVQSKEREIQEKSPLAETKLVKENIVVKKENDLREKETNVKEPDVKTANLNETVNKTQTKKQENLQTTQPQKIATKALDQTTINNKEELSPKEVKKEENTSNRLQEKVTPTEPIKSESSTIEEKITQKQEESPLKTTPKKVTISNNKKPEIADNGQNIEKEQIQKEIVAKETTIKEPIKEIQTPKSINLASIVRAINTTENNQTKTITDKSIKNSVTEISKEEQASSKEVTLENIQTQGSNEKFSKEFNPNIRLVNNSIFLNNSLHLEKNIEKDLNTQMDIKNIDKVQEEGVVKTENRSTTEGVVSKKETVSSFASSLKEQVAEYKPPIMKIQLDLNPRRLGSVEVVIKSRGKRLEVELTSNKQAINILTTTSSNFDLKTALSDIGFEDINMNFNQSSDKEKEKNQEEKNQPNFLENKEEDTEEESVNISFSNIIKGL